MTQRVLLQACRIGLLASWFVFLASCVAEPVGDISKAEAGPSSHLPNSSLAPTASAHSAAIGHEVGSIAPQFSLPNAAGGEVSLADFRGTKNIVVVFYRAFW